MMFMSWCISGIQALSTIRSWKRMFAAITPAWSPVALAARSSSTRQP